MYYEQQLNEIYKKYRQTLKEYSENVYLNNLKEIEDEYLRTFKAYEEEIEKNEVARQ